MCPRGQYCHIDLETNRRFCCDISSRVGFGDSQPSETSRQNVKRPIVGAADCLNGRCRPIAQSWFSVEPVTVKDSVTLPTRKFNCIFIFDLHITI